MQFQVFAPIIFSNGGVFFLSGSSLINDFDGGIVSAKYHLSDQSALRGSLGFIRTDQFQDQNSDREEMDPDSSITLQNFAFLAEELDLWTVDVSLVYLRYIQATPSLSMYVGAGPGFNLALDDESRSSGRQTITDREIFFTTLDAVVEDMWGTGFHFVLGGEWFITPGISFIAEYHSTLFYSSFERTRVLESANTATFNRNTFQEKVQGVSFESQPVRFGVSVYF